MAANYVQYTADTCPPGFSWGHPVSQSTGFVATMLNDCVDAKGQSVHGYYDSMAQMAGIALPLGMLLLLPGWSKLLGLAVAFTGVPGINLPDGSPMFRGAFYGGL